MKPTLLILAAGLGSRYGGVKQMDKIGPSGESIIDYSVFDMLSPECYLYLAQLLLHKQLSLRRLQRILHEEKDIVINNLQHLKRTGLITEDAGRIYTINKYVYKALVSQIIDKGLV